MKKYPIAKAPFYAITCGRFSESASGGIVTDTDLTVLKTDGSKIPGLYAVGDSCRGLFLKDDSGGKFGRNALGRRPAYGRKSGRCVHQVILEV